MYRTFHFNKKKGGQRQIDSPDKILRAVQKKLAYVLNLLYIPKPSVYGFIKNRNILENAKKHEKQKLILNIDLKDFFHQIHFGRIRGLFLKPPYEIGEKSATVIAQIACLNGKLPQGSPILTNIVCSSLDSQLIKFAKENSIHYTRYADDIHFPHITIHF